MTSFPDAPGTALGTAVPAGTEAGAPAEPGERTGTPPLAVAGVPHMAPVAAAERIEILDVLRGTALFGILAANMRGFAAPGSAYGRPDLLFPGFADRLTQGLLDVFVSSKCLTLFAFLFGIGFAVQMSRAEERGVRPASFYPRRLLVLLGLGLVHGVLIWWGDILVSYALAGFLLLPFRARQPRTVLRWAQGLLLALLVVMCTAFVAAQFQAPNRTPRQDPMQETARVIRLVHEGSPADLVAENARTWVEWIPSDLAIVIWLPTFLFGLWVGRQGIPRRLDAHAGSLRGICRVALPVGLGLSTAGVILRLTQAGPPQGPPGPLTFARALFEMFGPLVLALGYATGLALLARHEAWRLRLSPAAAVGRMALTNYLMQSVVGVALFTTTGLFGRVGPALLLFPTVAVFAGQVWLSNWWLARFRFGPVEWLWRSLTYGRLGPLRREATA